jgi:RecA-family ATPase
MKANTDIEIKTDNNISETVDEQFQFNTTVKAVDNHGALVIKSANEWMQEAASLGPIKRLVGDLWIDGEISILFASSGVGKSILAVQIADCISRGENALGLTNECPAQRVLYLDFELSTRQFGSRYHSDDHGNYQFNENFLRAELNTDIEAPTDKIFDIIIDTIEGYVVQQGLKIVIVDNITWLRNRTEDAKDAAPLMRRLVMLKKKHGLSMLILAHTPKRDQSKPIAQSDLQGSSMLMNFTDTSFAIGKSTQGAGIRYIKPMKTRSTAEDDGGIITCEIIKTTNFLKYDVHGVHASEREHLTHKSDDYWKEVECQILELHHRGKSQREIASHLDISTGKVNKVLKNVISN